MDPLPWQEGRAVSQDDCMCVSKHSLGFVEEVEKPVSLINVAETASIEDLSRLFSKLCLDDEQEKHLNTFKDPYNPFVIRLRDRSSKLICSIFSSSWHFSNFKNPLLKTSYNFSLENDEALFTKYLTLHSKPILSYYLNNSVNRLVAYRAVNLKSTCVDIIRTAGKDARYSTFPCSFYQEDKKKDATTVGRIETSSWVASDGYLVACGPLTYIYRRHSRFGIYLLNLLARAGRLSESASDYSRGRRFDFNCETDNSSKTYTWKMN